MLIECGGGTSRSSIFTEGAQSQTPTLDTDWQTADPFLPNIIDTCPIWGAMLAGVEAASRADSAG